MKMSELRRLLNGARAILVAHGFREHKMRGEVLLLRQRGPFLDTVDFWVSRSGEVLRFKVNCWTPFVVDDDVTLDTEIDLNYVGVAAGGDVSQRGVGDGEYWSIQSTEVAQQTASGIEQVLVDVVMPFLERIIDGDSFVTACATANRPWWRTVRQQRRDFIKSSIDRVIREGREIPPLRII